MPLRVCSILGPVLLLLLASSNSAFAQKKKPADANDPANDQATSEADAAAGRRATRRVAAKKARKNKVEAAPTPTPTENAEQFQEPDAWERPPADVEKPPARAAQLASKVDGDGRHISVGLVVGWGFLTDRRPGALGADPYGLGLGVRGGYSFDSGLYLGAFYSYYLGSSQTGVVGGTRIVNPATANYMLFGLEVGYDWWAGPVVVRPSLQLGVGLGITDYEITQSPLGSFLFGPGITVYKPFDGFFVGGDARASIVSGDGVSAFLLNLNGGMRFE
jgi:hypothetical protein